MFTQDEAAFEDSGDREGHEEPEEDEHDVVDGEGGGDTGHDLYHRSHQHGRSSSEPAEKRELLLVPSSYILYCIFANY